MVAAAMMVDMTHWIRPIFLSMLVILIGGVTLRKGPEVPSHYIPTTFNGESQMTELTPIVIALAALVSAVFGVLHGNLAALFSLLSPIISLRGVDFTKLKADLVALSPADLSSLESTFNASLSIPDPAMLARVVGAGSALEGAVIFGEQVVAQVTSLYAQGVSLVAQV